MRNREVLYAYPISDLEKIVKKRLTEGQRIEKSLVEEVNVLVDRITEYKIDALEETLDAQDEAISLYNLLTPEQRAKYLDGKSPEVLVELEWLIGKQPTENPEG